MPVTSRIAPCLWFDNQAEEAAAFYTGLFPNSKIVCTTRYPKAGHEIHARAEGSVMTVVFEIDGLRFTALNGGPVFTFNEAISLMVECATPKDVDYYWAKLGEGGAEDAKQCGWLKDKSGVSWQLIPAVLSKLLQDPGLAKCERVMAALLQIQEIGLAALQQGAKG